MPPALLGSPSSWRNLRQPAGGCDGGTLRRRPVCPSRQPLPRSSGRSFRASAGCAGRETRIVIRATAPARQAGRRRRIRHWPGDQRTGRTSPVARGGCRGRDRSGTGQPRSGSQPVGGADGRACARASWSATSMGASCSTTSGHACSSRPVRRCRRRELIGLGRSLYAVFERSLIAACARSGRTPPAGGRDRRRPNLSRRRRQGACCAHLAPVTGHREEMRGRGRVDDRYVLLLDDITPPSRRKQARCADPVADRRRPRAARQHPCGSEMLNNYPDMEAEQRARFLSVILNGVRRAVRPCRAGRQGLRTQLSGTLEAGDARRRPRCLCRGLPVSASLRPAGQGRGHRRRVWMKVDSFSFLQVLCYLTARLRDDMK